MNVLDPLQSGDPEAPVNVATTTARALQQASGSTGSYLVFVQLTNIEPAYRALGRPDRCQH